jgi:Protein of unknown function (DUF3500)
MGIAQEMNESAETLLTALAKEGDGRQHALATHAFTDDAARRWLEYRPEPRPGACIAEFSIPARKAVHRLLATALSEHAYAQAMAIISLEEVLDRREGWRRGRHSGDYWISLFGEPGGSEPWAWRFEGHHLSVSMTIADGEVSPTPLFFGANPAHVSYAGRTVSRPLAPEEDLARELLDAMGPAGREQAVVAGHAPEDIRSGPRPQAPPSIEPLGVAASQLGQDARALLSELVALYLDRLPPELAALEGARLGELHVAWEGPLIPGPCHYYRIQGDDLLIEYDTTDDGDHAHTVLRRPRGDYGADILAAHLGQEHEPADRGTVG